MDAWMYGWMDDVRRDVMTPRETREQLTATPNPSRVTDTLHTRTDVDTRLYLSGSLFFVALQTRI